MALQYSAAVLKIRTGAAVATFATADSGTVLATMTLPSDWLAAASSGSKAKSGTWQDTSADATGGGGDLTLDNTSIASGQAIAISSFSITAANS